LLAWPHRLTQQHSIQLLLGAGPQWFALAATTPLLVWRLLVLLVLLL
jgi:hypothetical protein